MTKEYTNGKCALGIDVDVEETFMRIEQVHNTIGLVHQDTKYLKDIHAALVSIKTELIDVVIGKNMVPIDVARTMIEEQRKTYTTIIRLICWVFGTMILVLTGLKYLAPQILN